MEVPDEFDSEEEVKQYIDHLHDRIEFLQNEFDKSEKEKLELKQELEEAEATVSVLDFSDEVEQTRQVTKTIEELNRELEELEEYLQQYGGGPSQSATDTLSDSLGYDIDQDK